MEGHILLRSLKLQNILSYGNEGAEIELQPLNVLVGPTGSGKSNLIEAIRLLQATPVDLTQPIILGGGIHEWFWKGEKESQLSFDEPVLIEVSLSDRVPAPFETIYTHTLKLDRHSVSFRVSNECILIHRDGKQEEWYVNDAHRSYAQIWAQEINSYQPVGSFGPSISMIKIEREKLKPNQSILAQRNDLERYPHLFTLSSVYEDAHIYTDAPFGRGSAPRLPQNADADASFLAEDYSNLALVLNEMQLNVGAFRRLLENLKLFYERVENIVPRVSYGTVQLYFQEKGLQQLVPATRLSDGTLRYLCLLAILCHPSPPSLICIEEPELGMHPDILPTLAKLLIEASQRTQLIVTTHSDILLSEFADIPEAVIVCDRDDNGTSLKHLNKEDLQIWLREYSLGEAWLKNAFGGTRW